MLTIAAEQSLLIVYLVEFKSPNTNLQLSGSGKQDFNIVTASCYLTFIDMRVWTAGVISIH